MEQKNTTYILRQDWHALLNSLTHINCKFISLCLKQRHVEDLSVSDWKQSVPNQDVFKYIQNDEQFLNSYTIRNSQLCNKV